MSFSRSPEERCTGWGFEDAADYAVPPLLHHRSAWEITYISYTPHPPTLSSGRPRVTTAKDCQRKHRHFRELTQYSHVRSHIHSKLLDP